MCSEKALIQAIPHGCRKHHIPGLGKAAKKKLQYCDKFDQDPFSPETIDKGETLASHKTNSRKHHGLNTWSRLISPKTHRRHGRNSRKYAMTEKHVEQQQQLL